MGVGARAGRAVRVCDIVGPVSLGVCGGGGGLGLRDPCAPRPGLRDPARPSGVPRLSVCTGPPGAAGSVAYVGVSLCAGSEGHRPALGISA